MNGSNSIALRQHAYSVFTASRRDTGVSGEVPASVRHPMAPTGGMGEAPRPTPSRGNAPAAGQLAEPKSSPPAASAGMVGGGSPASRATQGARSSSSPGEAAEAKRGAEPTDAEIRVRAYERYLARKGQDADPVADWLAAEAELRRERGLA